MPIAERFALLLLLVILTSGVSAQYAGINFENITIKDGLPSNKVNYIARDSLGFFWYGTTLGLVRSDGHRFDIWRHNPLDSMSIPNSDIRLIKVDTKSKVWVLTWNGDLFVYDPFRPFSERVKILLFLDEEGSPDRIGALENDWEGYTYAFSKTGRLYRVDQQGLSPERIDFQLNKADQPLPFNPRSSLLTGHFFWIGAENGLYQIDLKTNLIKKIDISGFARQGSTLPEGIERMHSFDDNSIIFTGLRARFSFNGLLVYNFLKDSLYRPTGLIHNKYKIETLPIHRLWPVGNKRFFFSPWGKPPFYFDFNTSTGDTLELNRTNKNKLNTSSINEMYIEPNGRITIGSNQGIFIHDPFSYLFHEVLPYEKLDQYPNRNFNVHHDLRKDQLIIATNEMILIYDYTLEKVVQETYYPQEPNFRNSNKVPEIIELTEDRLMIISNRVYIYNIPARELRPFDIPGMIEEAPFRNSFPKAVVRGRESEYRVIKDGYLLHIKTGLSPEVEAVKLSDASGEPWNPEANGAGMDSKERMWISTRSSLFKIENTRNPKGERVKWNLDTLVRIYDVLVDRADIVWAATRDHGLQRCRIISGDSLFCEFFDLRHGLAINRIFNLQEDQFNTLWMTTLYGVSSFDKSSEIFTNYGKQHGINFPHNMRPGKGKNKLGHLFFSEGIGIIRFDPAVFQKRSGHPPVYISQFSIDEIPVCSFWSDTSITLKWWQRNFSFTISAVNHTHAYMNKYWYQLENFHKNWLRTDHDNLTINFNRMKAGKYAFKARASNHQNTLNDDGITIHLQLLPPFWESWWFLILCIILIILSIRWYITFRIQQSKELELKLIRKEIETQTEERKRIAQDLHDDIGAQLSTLKMYVSALNRDLEKKEDIKELSEETQQMISRTIRDMRHIITELSPQSLSTYGYVAALNEFIYYLRKSTDIDIAVDVSHFTASPGKNEEAALYRITQELFNNTIKHARAKHIVFKLETRGGENILFYTDDGQGFNQEKVANAATSGRGLFNIASRVKFLKGKMVVNTEPGKGVQIKITFPA
jgi:signal transduction histidine kinase